MPEFPCSGPITATVRIASGGLRVVAEPRSTVEVDVQPGSSGEAARTAAAHTRVEMTADALLIEVPQARGFVMRRTPPLNITVRVPFDSRFRIWSASADITCFGRLGALSTNTATGDLRAEHIAGDLERHGASGDTTVETITGNGDIVHASGDLNLGSISGDIAVRSASGDIAINTIGGSVKMATASGDIRLGSLSAGSAKINAASGDVTVGVAEGTAVWLDLNSITGDTRSELAISQSTPTGTALNLNLQVRTVSGDIKVRRAAGSPVAAVANDAKPSRTGPADAGRQGPSDAV